LLSLFPFLLEFSFPQFYDNQYHYSRNERIRQMKKSTQELLDILKNTPAFSNYAEQEELEQDRGLTFGLSEPVDSGKKSRPAFSHPKKRS